MQTPFSKMSPAGRTAYVTKNLFLAGCVFIALFPVFWVVMSSFKTNAEIMGSGISLPSQFSFDGYVQALKISPIMRFFFNSVVISFAATFINVLLLSMAAYVFARCRFRHKNTLYFILSLSMVIPMTALLQPVYLVIKALNLINTMQGLILVYTALNMPMSLMILRTAFSGVPRSLEEAAYMDGAGFVRTFFQIMVPAAKSGLASAAVLTFLNCWNEFTFALVLTSTQNVRTLPLSLNYFTSQFSFNYTAMFAAITITVLPSLLIFAIFQEQVVSSLTAGAVKE